MVELDESRRFATNYFRLMADAQIASRALAKANKEAPLRIEDIDYNAQPMMFEKEIINLLCFYRTSLVPQLLHELDNGFNLALYGFGCKLKVLDMIRERLPGALFIDSYDPCLTLNSLYQYFLSNHVDLKNPPASFDHTVIIYGLDSYKLRHDSFYRYLAAASAQGLKLVVTFEDPNFSLLLSPQRMDQFNFIFHDTTTCLPYGENELESLPEIISSRTCNKRSIKGALFVLQSLTTNARGIFKLLADNQLSQSPSNQENKYNQESDSENEDESEVFEGLSQIELFKLAQNQFLISNEQAFRTILTEFLDHELIKLARSGVNGAEVLRIPFSPSNIREILSILSSM